MCVHTAFLVIPICKLIPSSDVDYGRNDPVARKILATHASTVGLSPPDDKTVISLFLSSLASTTTEELVRASFASLGVDEHAIRSVVVVPQSNCAFVNFRNRETAENAAQRSSVRMQVDGKEVSVRWGRSKLKPGASKAASTSAAEAATA